MKKIFMIMISAFTLFLLIGCSSNEKDSSGSELVVYCVQGNDFYDEALAGFKRVNQEISLEVVNFDTAEELSKKFAAEGLSKNGADVVLLSSDLEIDLQKLMQEEKCLDMTTFFSEQKIYESGKYVNKVLEAGRSDGTQYILPFTYDMGLVIGRTSVYDLSDTDFSLSTDFDSFTDILLDAQKDMYDSKDVRLGIDLSARTLEERLMYMYRISGLALTDGKVLTSDKEQVRILCDFVKAAHQEFEEKYGELANSGSNSAKLIGYVVAYGNPAAIIRKNEYAYELVAGETIEFDGICSLDDGYHGTVRDCAFINAKSRNTEVAYKLLKYILDYDYNGLDVGYSLGGTVNKDNYLKQLDTIKTWEYAMSGGMKVPISAMSDAHYEEVQELLEQISGAYLINHETEAIFIETMAEYISDTKDFDSCYEQMKNRINIYLKE